MLRRLLLGSLVSSFASAAGGDDCSQATNCATCVGDNTVSGSSRECYWCESEQTCVDSDTFEALPIGECRTTVFDGGKCALQRRQLGQAFDWGGLFQSSGDESGTLAPERTMAPEEESGTERVIPTAAPTGAPTTKQPTEQPTEQPTRQPTVRGTPPTTAQPSLAPTRQPTRAPTTLRPTALPTAAPTAGPVSPMTCDQLRWLSVGGHPDVCAESEINGKCYLSSTFKEAEALCAGVGARLCSRAELELGNTKGSGCKLDNARVWSSSSCPGGAFSTAGSFVYAAEFSTECSSSSTRLGVRCCADQGTGETKGASSSCAALGWNFSPSGAARNVCSESKIGGQCASASGDSLKSFRKASTFCSEVGARLCTSEELEADVAVGSGCKLDYEWVWSSDVCGDGSARHKASGGSSAAGLTTRCLSDDVELGARCCADAK